MTTFTSILTGIGIGLATSVIGWFLALVFVAPRVSIEDLPAGEESAAWPAYQFRVASRRKRRKLTDVQVRCDLRIPHHGGQENVLRLKASSTEFPFVPAGWMRIITVAMEPASLTADFGQPELRERLAELTPPKDLSEVESLRTVFHLLPGSRIEVAVFASDPLSGARRASHGSLIPSDSR
jgi:hypothetical protein